MVAAPTVAPANAVYTSTNAYNATDSKKVDVTFSTNSYTSATSYSLVLYYDTNVNVTKDIGESSITLPMAVNQAGVIINSIKIDKTVDMSLGTPPFYYQTSADVSVYKVSLGDGYNAYTLSTKAFDALGGEVGVLASDIIYTITSATTLAGGWNSPAGTNVTLTGNALTVKSTSGNSVVGANVTIKATAQNGKTDSIDLVFERQAPAAQSGTYYFGLTSDAAKVDAKTTLTLNSYTATDKKLDIYVVAIDQYGFVFPVTTRLPVSKDDTSFFATSNTAGKITITAVKVGTTNLRVVIDSNNALVIPVTIDETAITGLAPTATPTSTPTATPTPTPNILYGDVNNDTVVDNKDLVLFKRYFAGVITTFINPSSADVNNDGVVDNKDLVLVKRYFAGVIVKFSAQP